MLPALTGGGAGNGEQTSILIWYALNIAAGPNTVTISGAGIDVGITAVEYSGVATSGAIGITSTLPYFGGTPTTTPTSSSFTPSAGSLLFVAFADETNPQNSIAAGSGYTLIQGDGNHVDIEEDNVNSSAGSQTASITVSFATWSWAMYVVEFLPAGASSPPVGTVLWSNPGDGSGVSWILPAVPSATGVADVFGFQNDGTVAAITSDGTTAWTASTGDASAALADFQGGLVLLGSSLSRLDGMTGQVSSTYAYPPNMSCCSTVLHTDGTIFLSGSSTADDQTAGETYVMGVDPLSGSQKFNFGMGDATPGSPGVGVGWRSASGGAGVLIVAGDGNAYAVGEWREIVARDPDTNRAIYQFHIDALKVSSSGTSQLIRVWDYPADFTPQSFNPHIITDADQGVAINWRDGLNDQIYLALVSGGGVVVSIAPGRQNLTSDMQSVLQLQDGTFVGAIVEMGIAGERPVKHALRAKAVIPPSATYPNPTIVAYDRSGNYKWLVPGDYPTIATSDGGVIGQSGTTYDQNGNVTGRGDLPGLYSWIGGWYGISSASAIQASFYPAIDVADSFAAFAQGNSSQNRTANRPLAKSVQQLIAQTALSYVGSTNWLDTVGNNQCNIFVKAVLQQAGLTPPMSPVNPSWQHRAAYLLRLVDTPGYPAQAKDWATPSTELKCWRAVTVTQAPVGPQPLPPDISVPGDVIAQAINYSDATGHVGIIVGPQQTASADSAATCVSGAPAGIIDITNFGFRPDGWVSPQTSPNGTPCATSGQKSKVVVKRFVCQ